ncbi:MAG: hypothetical protein AAF639_12320 [Chloroflexota bacterium]
MADECMVPVPAWIYDDLLKESKETNTPLIRVVESYLMTSATIYDGYDEMLDEDEEPFEDTVENREAAFDRLMTLFDDIEPFDFSEYLDESLLDDESTNNGHLGIQTPSADMLYFATNGSSRPEDADEKDKIIFQTERQNHEKVLA